MQAKVSSAPVEALFDESLRLTREAQRYIAGSARDDRLRLDGPTRMALASEITRLTRRMTVAVVWMRLQRAVLAGEMAIAEMAGRFPPLLENDMCLEASMDPGLPSRLRDLLRRSLALYWRVARLDESMRIVLAGGSLVPSPMAGRRFRVLSGDQTIRPTPGACG